MADVLDAGFDATFEFGIAHRRGHGLEKVVPGESQEARIELHGGAHMVQDHALEIVVDDPARHAGEEFESATVHAAESLHLLVEGEIDEESARPGQDHGKDGERALGAADAEVAEAAPVHLGLLASIGFDAQIGPAWTRRPNLSHIAPKLGDAQRTTAVAQFEQQPSRGQLGQIDDAIDDVGLECVERTRQWGRLRGRLVAQRPPNGPVVDTELARHHSDA